MGLRWDGVWDGCDVEIDIDISWEEATCEVEANIIETQFLRLWYDVA